MLNAQLFEITATDPRVLVGAAVGLLTVAIAAALVPATRAARINPVVALRAE